MEVCDKIATFTTDVGDDDDDRSIATTSLSMGLDAMVSLSRNTVAGEVVDADIHIRHDTHTIPPQTYTPYHTLHTYHTHHSIHDT